MLSILPLALVALLSTTCDVSGQITVDIGSRSIPRRQTSLKRRAESNSSVPLTDFFSGTELQWFGNVSVGTPPQTFSVVFDTGSILFEIPGTQCGAPCSTQRKFDPTKSSSWNATGQTKTLTFGTGVGVDPVIGSNYQLNMTGGTDTVQIAGFNVSNATVFLITNQTEKFSPDPFDGILGLGPGQGGLFNSLVAQGLPAQFGFALTPHGTPGAQLTLGGFDSSKFSGNLQFTSVDLTNGWVASSTGATINNTKLQVSTAQILFDTGTSNIVFPQSDTETIYAAISPSIKPHNTEPGTYGIPCSELSSLTQPISFSFRTNDTQGAAFSLSIPPANFNVGPFADNSSLCQMFINAWDEKLGILGGSVFKQYYSAWDVRNSMIGFAPISASNSSTPGSSQGGAQGGSKGSASVFLPNLVWLLASVWGLVFL